MNASTSELYISTESLSSNPPDTTAVLQTIAIKNLPAIAPKVVTKTNTLRRCCGFTLALIGFLFYCARITSNFILIAYLKLLSENKGYTDSVSVPAQTNFDLKLFILEFVACNLGIGMFFRILRNPKLTLEESNFKVKQNKMNFICVLLFVFRMFGCFLLYQFCHF